MRVVLCALAKNEHLYINDWVNHYVGLGIDKIYLYDNDDSKSPYIGNYITQKDKVEIINIRGVHKDKLQHDIYTTFYNTHSFDWCLFVDIDEYLVGITNIKQFLSNPIFHYYNQIRIKWRLFGDDNLIERDMSIPVMQAFKQEVKHSLNRNLRDKGTLEKQGKMIVRGNLDNVVIRSPHFASKFKRDNVLFSCLPNGRATISQVVIRDYYDDQKVFINHYMTKSLKEFLDQKLNRTDAVFGDISIKMNYYWRINKKTPEKLAYLRKRGINGEI